MTSKHCISFEFSDFIFEMGNYFASVPERVEMAVAFLLLSFDAQLASSAQLCQYALAVILKRLSFGLQISSFLAYVCICHGYNRCLCTTSQPDIDQLSRPVASFSKETGSVPASPCKKHFRSITAKTGHLLTESKSI
jgi:hypothetical protein